MDILKGEALEAMISDVKNRDVGGRDAKEAMMLSIAKWHPIRKEERGEGACGLCNHYDWTCDGCPFDCDTDGVWGTWDISESEEERSDCADIIYNNLVALYLEMYGNK